MVNSPKRISSQKICPGTSFQSPDQRIKNGEEILQIRETFMPTSGQACDIQDQEPYLDPCSSFLSKPSSLLTLRRNMPEINMGKIIWQIRKKYKEEVKVKTVKEAMKFALEFCKELVESCIPESNHRIFSILKPSKLASYSLFLLYILQVDECELRWQLVLQPSLLWKFHGWLYNEILIKKPKTLK
jgi:hypothetical protein